MAAGIRHSSGAPAVVAAAVAAALWAAGVLAAGPGWAQDCGNPQTQLEMNSCAALDWEAADAVLNAEYRRARPNLEEIGSGAEALRDAQRAWVTFRDKACEAEGAQYQGGSIQPMIGSQCLARLTRQRSEDLRALGET